MNTTQNTYDEQHVESENVVTRVREILREGNVRRLTIKKDDGETLLEVPLTAGVAVTAVGALVSPALVAIGVIAAMSTSVTIGVERRDGADSDDRTAEPVLAG